MKKMVVLCLALTLLAGCAAPIGGTDQTTVAQSSKPRNTNPGASQETLSTLVKDNNNFGLALYQTLRTEPGNLFLSPYSVSVALAMTQAGANGATLQQMNQALHFTLPAADVHPAFNALQLALNSREKNDQDPKKRDFELRVANAIWGEKTYTFKPEYLDLLSENYGAGVRLLDFKNAPEPSRQTINQWVSDQTEQKIQNLLPEGTITNLSRLVLTNAIYFKANWQSQFDAANTKPGDFTLLDGSKVQTPMMYQSHEFGYAKGDGYEAVELPYQSGKLSMVILLPNEGQFGDIEKSLDGARMQAISNELQIAQVNLSMPKFKIESAFGLADSLKVMGMQDAFDPNKADFSGMDGTRDLYISAVEHKAYVSVDEKGTEAAAATGVVVGTTAAPAQVVDLKIDRPFLFSILDKESGTVLFVGRLVQPI
jgi:serpin B